MKKYFLILSAVAVGTLGAPNSNNLSNIYPAVDWRVIGGFPAPEGVFTYQISMRRSDGGHKCGGSIFDSTTILTAAHCVDRTAPADIHVVVGSTKLDSGGTKHAVIGIKAHEDYDRSTFHNDIAILKLATPIEFSSTVTPVELETSDVGADQNAVLTGWGMEQYPGPTPNDLQYIYLKTISVEDCKERHWTILPVLESQICTLTREGEGACHGDSGGPLVLTNRKQVGIVSYGKPCAKGYPDVYTRVSFYKNWINIHSQ